MKSFSQFIAEAQQVHKFSDTILKQYEMTPFVLRSTMWNRIFPDTAEVVAFHMTDTSGFENLVKRQGRKTSISTFNAVQGNHMNFVLGGVEVQGHVLIKMKGKSAGNFAFDAFTARTDKGHRTILLGGEEWDEFSHMLTPKNQKTFHLLRTHLSTTLQKMVAMKNPEDMDGREKQKFIKDYLDATEAYVKQNADSIRDMFKNEIEVVFNKYNEVVMEYPKILKAYIVDRITVRGEFDPSRAIETAIKNKIPYEVVSIDDLREILRKDPDMEKR